MALRAGYYGVKRRIWEALQRTSEKLVQDVSDIWNNNDITGAKNFLAIPIRAVKATNQNGVWAGNVYTINGGTFTFNVVGDYITDVVINGTFTVDTTVATNAFNDNVKVSGDGDYIPSGISGGSASTYSLIFNYKETLAGSEKGLITLYSDGNTVKAIDSDWLLKLYLVAKAGSYTNVSIKPMLRLANDPDTLFEPYAMTNQELTKKVNGVYNADFYLAQEVTAANLNNYTTPISLGWSGSNAAGITNRPSDFSASGMLQVMRTWGEYCRQILYPRDSAAFYYMRVYQNGVWSSWYKYAGTEVTQSKAPEDIAVDPKISEEEPEIVVKKSTKKKATTKEEEV